MPRLSQSWSSMPMLLIAEKVSRRSNNVVTSNETMKKNLNIIILGLAALSLSSCKTLYGKYERPDVKTNGIVRDSASISDTLAVKDTTSFANIPWRSVFTDPQLQTLIEKGLANNANLLNAALNLSLIHI